MRKKVIGINQRIPLQILEMALRSYLNGNYNEEYILEQLRLDFDGENRIRKALDIVNKIIRNNPIITEIENDKERILVALKRENDKNLILTSLSCTAFPYFYEVLKEFARYLKVQDVVSTDLIRKTMASWYGSNRSMENALYCVIPMLIEAKIIDRPKSGIYKKSAAKEYSPTSVRVLKLAVNYIGGKPDLELISELFQADFSLMRGE